MNKKIDFTTNTNKIQTISDATAQDTQEEQELQQLQAMQEAQSTRKTYTDAEAVALMQELKTAGHKGVKLPRMNVAFTPEIFDYVRTMSKLTGKTYTEFLNIIVKKYMDQHMDLYNMAKTLRDSL